MWSYGPFTRSLSEGELFERVTFMVRQAHHERNVDEFMKHYSEAQEQRETLLSLDSSSHCGHPQGARESRCRHARLLHFVRNDNLASLFLGGAWRSTSGPDPVE